MPRPRRAPLCPTGLRRSDPHPTGPVKSGGATTKDMNMTTTIQEHRPFNLRYILREPGGIHGEDMRMLHRTASCNYRYIMRENGVDEFGPTPDFAARRDLFDHGRRAPVACRGEAYAGVKIWEAADAAARERRPQLATAMHAVGSLPRDGDRSSWRAMVEALNQDHLADQGMVVDWAIHVAPDDGDSLAPSPHVHWLITSRMWRRDRDHGRHQKPWLSTKAQVDRLAEAWFEITGLYPVDYRKPAG